MTRDIQEKPAGFFFIRNGPLVEKKESLGTFCFSYKQRQNAFVPIYQGERDKIPYPMHPIW